MEAKTILIVDDDYLNRRLTKKVLLGAGYSVEESKNAEQALGILSSTKIDLAILDINLGDGEIDGISLGKLIQNKSKVKFIYLTAYDNPKVINSAIATAPYSYLTKPYKNSDLIAAIELAILKSVNDDKPVPCIEVKEGDYKIKLPIHHINYIESDGNYLKIYTNSTTYNYRSTLTQIKNELPSDMFIQTHRAFIINKEKIQKYNSKSVIINNTEIPLSVKDVF